MNLKVLSLLIGSLATAGGTTAAIVTSSRSSSDEESSASTEISDAKDIQANIGQKGDGSVSAKSLQPKNSEDSAIKTVQAGQTNSPNVTQQQEENTSPQIRTS